MEKLENYFCEVMLCYCRFCLKSLKVTDASVSLLLIKNNINKYQTIFPDTTFEDTFKYEVNISSNICEACHDALNQTIKFLDMVTSNEQKLQLTYEKYKMQMVKQELEIDIKEEPTYLEFDNFVEVQDDLISDSEIVKPKVNKTELYTCDICTETFKTKAAIYQHVRTHKQKIENKIIDISKYLICELCKPNPNFPTFEEMCKHYEDMHGTPGYVICCKSKFSNKKSVIKHEDVHLNPIKYACDTCDKRCTSAKLLRKHKLLMHGSGSKFECELCSKKFTLKHSLACHMRRIHVEKNRNNFQCHVCEKLFSSKAALNQHLLSFHDIGDKTWELCDQCEFKTRYRKNLLSHIETMHSGKNAEPCPICGKKVKGLKKHMALQHFSKSQICAYCGYEAKNNKLYKSHMRIHSDEK